MIFWRVFLIQIGLLLAIMPPLAIGQTSLEVAIEGIEAPLLNNVRLLLSIEQYKNNGSLNLGRILSLHKKAPGEISRALQPYGYYQAEIQASLDEVTVGQWQAKYVINKGPALTIAELSIKISGEITNDPDYQSLNKDFFLQKGDIFDHIKYESMKNSLAEFAVEHGYFKGRFLKHKVEIDLKQYQANVWLHYDSGKRYRFGKVTLDQSILEQDFLQRYIPFQAKEAYSLSKLIELQQALNDSDYFKTVEVSPADIETDSLEIPVQVNLTPRSEHRYSLGLGFGSDTGARAKFEWEMPHINSRGHRFNSQLKISEIGNTLDLRYRVPVLNPRSDQLVYSGGIITEDTDTNESTIRTIGVSLNRSHGLWREIISLNYQQEDYLVADVQGESSLLIPGINWSRNWGSKIIYTLDGLRLDIGLRGSSNSLVSDTSFSQLQMGIKGIHSLGQKYRLLARVDIGITRTEAFEQLPSSVRFFAGGAQSVRGYAYESLGPLDENGEVIGGKHLLTTSLEIERNFNSKWGIAVFYDAGDAMDDFDEPLNKGAGIGLRWNTPVGPVRFDLANAISKDGNPWRVHINIGPDL